MLRGDAQEPLNATVRCSVSERRERLPLTEQVDQPAQTATAW
jgi:hypothetical protein